MLASPLPHISQRYSPQLTPAALRSSQLTIPLVTAPTLPPLHLVARSYWIGSIPRLRSLFAGLALRLGRADATAGIASASTAARQTMYPIRIFIATGIGNLCGASTPLPGVLDAMRGSGPDRPRNG